MSELLVIRHAESQSNTGITENLDSALTDIGVRQSCATAVWLYNNFDLKDYVGFTTPYLRGLQTASIISEITGVPFVVEAALREFRFVKKGVEVKDGGIKIPNRSIPFRNINWTLKEWSDENVFFTAEGVEEFVDRSVEFLCRCKETNEKCLVLTHGAPGAMLIRLASGISLEEIKNECLEVQSILTSGKPRATLEHSLFLSGLKNCGLTWIRDDQVMFLSKVAYE